MLKTKAEKQHDGVYALCSLVRAAVGEVKCQAGDQMARSSV